MTDFTKWTVTSKSKSASDTKTSEESVNVCTGAKTGNIVHILNIMGNGGREEIWSNGKVMVATNSQWKSPMVVSGTPRELLPVPGWISAKNFVKVQKRGEKEYLVFRDRVFPGGSEITADMVGPGFDPESLKVDASASIDAETRLPAGVQMGGEVITYKFESLQPEVMQTFPTNVQAAITNQVQQIRAATRKPVRP